MLHVEKMQLKSNSSLNPSLNKCQQLLANKILKVHKNVLKLLLKHAISKHETHQLAKEERVYITEGQTKGTKWKLTN